MKSVLSAGLSLDTQYTVTVDTSIDQFDAAKGAFPIKFQDNWYITLPLNVPPFGSYHLVFSNIADFDEIPMTNVDTAREFVQKYELDALGYTLRDVKEDFVFRLLDAPPSFSSMEPTVRGTIVAARVRTSRLGQVAYVFPTTASPTNVTAGDVGPRLAPLRSSASQGVRFGMSFSDAVKVVQSGFEISKVDAGASSAAFFNGFSVPYMDSTNCGELAVQNEGKDLHWTFYDVHVGAPDLHSYTACFAFRAKAGGKVSEIWSRQIFSPHSLAAIESSLREKYGPPERISRSPVEIDLDWNGSDPEDTTQAVHVSAGFTATTLDLAISAGVDRRNAPKPVATTGPKF